MNIHPIKVLCIFGTRPEAIKMAPVVGQLGRRPDEFVPLICVTAQHRRMLDDVLRLFAISPDFDLDVMEDGQTPGQVTTAVLAGLDPILSREEPNWVLIQGDTTTTMASALAAFYRRVKVGHVEAGLRTYDKARPYPEEMNRQVTSRIADLHFAPTPRARDNLLAEGVDEADIVVTGNTVVDALLEVSAAPFDGPAVVRDLIDGGKRLILLTAHRRESFGLPLRGICRAVDEIARRYRGQVEIVYPVHLNPHVQQTAHQELGGIPNVTLLPPVDYQTLVHLMKGSHLILTDSGGIQEEAPSLGVPVLVLREVTERPEAVEAGAAKVVGVDPASIVAHTRRLLDDEAEHRRMSRAMNPFGDGFAAVRIVEMLAARSGKQLARSALS